MGSWFLGVNRAATELRVLWVSVPRSRIDQVDPFLIRESEALGYRPQKLREAKVRWRRIHDGRRAEQVGDRSCTRAGTIGQMQGPQILPSYPKMMDSSGR